MTEHKKQEKVGTPDSLPYPHETEFHRSTSPIGIDFLQSALSTFYDTSAIDLISFHSALPSFSAEPLFMIACVRLMARGMDSIHPSAYWTERFFQYSSRSLMGNLIILLRNTYFGYPIMSAGTNNDRRSITITPRCFH